MQHSLLYNFVFDTMEKNEMSLHIMNQFLSSLKQKNEGCALSAYFHADTLRLTLIATAVWGLIAHGFCYFNLSYSHDSMMVYQNDYTHQISIGRFLHPAYLFFRGNIVAPALCGVLSLVFVAFSAYLLLLLTEREDKLSIWLYTGILTSNASLTLLNATYIFDSDIYMFSLLLSVLSVFVCRKLRFGFLLSACLMVMSLGLYQAFFQFAVGLYMVLALKNLLNGKSLSDVLAEGIRAVGSLVLALLLYYLLWRGILANMGITASTEYNGLQDVGQYDSVLTIFSELYNAYAFTIRFFAKPRIFHSQSMAYVNGVLLLLSGLNFCLILARRKFTDGKLVLAFLLFLLFPLGINVISVISHGMEHDLMVFSFALFYLLSYELFRMEQEQSLSPESGGTRHLLKKLALPGVLSVILLNSIIYSNQVYVSKNLIYQNTRATMNRIIGRLEQNDAFLSGDTPVAFVGSLNSSPLVSKTDLSLEGTGLYYPFSLSYYETFSWYFKDVAPYPLTLVDEDSALALSEDSAVKKMSPFPAKDSIQLVNGVLVVKLS